MSTRQLILRPQGFSLIEVLVALIIISVGLLGIAKMQSLAVSSTGTARMRSLAAIQAASLAAAMRANRAYWGATPPSTGITVSGSTVSTSDATLSAAVTAAKNCISGKDAPCSPANLAAYDLAKWTTALNNLLPSPTATITCPTSSPLYCSIQISWSENSVAINKQEAAVAAGNIQTSTTFQNPTYTLYVEP